MKITILNDEEVLKEIELTNLRFKAIQLSGQKPEDYLSYKIERILDFAVNQSKQTIDRISPLTDKEMEAMIDTLEAEKVEEKKDVKP